MPLQNNLRIRSEEVQDILTAVPNWMILWGNTLIFALIGGLLGMSFYIKYPDIIPSEALITTIQPPHHEYAKVAGKIDTLFVENHQQVETGVPLAIIENPAHFTDVFTLKKLVTQNPVDKHNFTFPIDQLPLLILGDIENAFAIFENNYNQYSFNKQWQPLANEIKANQNSLKELNHQLSNLELQQELFATELKLKEKELERQKQLFEQGLISEQAFQEQQLERLQIERNFKSSQLTISQTREAIGKVEQSFKGTALNQSKEEKILLRKAIQSFNMLKKAIRDWELQYVLRADIPGKVSFLDYWTENQRLSQGDLVFTIIPEAANGYIAQLKSPAQNSGKIRTGQTVNIKLDNYPDTEFGVLQGRIKDIALIADEEGLYKIEVALADSLHTSYN